jgi:hypothetical protein
MSVYGDQDFLSCLTYPASQNGLPTDQFPGQHICLGFRYTVHWAGIPYSVTDEGYVLTTEHGKEYISITPKELADLQAMGTFVGKPPAYDIPIGWRLGVWGGYALVALLVGVAIWRALQRRSLRHARGKAEITRSGPVVKTSGDRKIAAAMREHLDGGEQITHQAIAYDRKPDTIRALMHLTALTDKRLLMVTTRLGLLGLFRGTPQLRAIERAEIGRIDAGDEDLVLVLTTGERLRLHVPLGAAGYSSANQRAFLLDLPRLLAA